MYSKFENLLIYRNMENLDCTKQNNAEHFKNIRDMNRRQQPRVS